MSDHNFHLFLFLILWLIGVWVFLSYNRLLAYRNECRSALAQVDVQLQRRHDLLPKLEALLKGSMGFEAATLEGVARLRAQALAAPELWERLKAESALGFAVGGLLAKVEAYPELRSMEQALELQRQVASTEDRIAFSRTYYNDVCANYNTLCAGFPVLLIARRLGFEPQPWFDERRP